MEDFDVTQAIENFMHPTVYTGVVPILLVAEELVTDISIGHVCEAVWARVTSPSEFSYISKFAVTGKIILGKYYQPNEVEPFKGRLALVNDKNLKNVVLHKELIRQIKELELKRYKLLDTIQKDFDVLQELSLKNEDIYLFEHKNGEWDKELFCNFDINTPYKLVDIDKDATELQLKKHKSQTVKKYTDTHKFYGFFVGSIAEITGLKLKDESYLTALTFLQNKAKSVIKEIEWLELNDPTLQKVLKKLPKHPFEEYFPYVKKEDIRQIDVSDALVTTLKKIILQHIPENDTPLGMKYIPIDKLLFLFHMIIPREDALLALEECDIIYEPPAMVLGHSGKHQLPPKYLVPITHVAHTYQRFPDFISVCENFDKGMVL